MFFIDFLKPFKQILRLKSIRMMNKLLSELCDTCIATICINYTRERNERAQKQSTKAFGSNFLSLASIHQRPYIYIYETDSPDVETEHPLTVLKDHGYTKTR